MYLTRKDGNIKQVLLAGGFYGRRRMKEGKYGRCNTLYTKMK
jgi:hypothetical protein